MQAFDPSQEDHGQWSYEIPVRPFGGTPQSWKFRLSLVEELIGSLEHYSVALSTFMFAILR